MRVLATVFLVLAMFVVMVGGAFAGGQGEAAVTEDGPVSITMWHSMSGAHGEQLEMLVEAFHNSHPDIEVVVEYAGGYPDALNQLTLAAQRDDHPNIMQVYDIGTQTMLDSGTVVPLAELIQEFPDVPIQTEDYFSAAVDYYSVDGELYALPFAISSPVLYYNKDMFRDAGLDPESPPETYTDFLEYAEILTDPASDQVGASWAIRSWLVEQQVALQNSYFFNNDNGRSARPTEVLFNEAPAVSFIELWSQMAREGYYVNPGRSWADARNNFISGVSAMMLQSTAGISRTLDGVGDSFEMGTAALPRPEGADGGIIASGNALWPLAGHSAREEQAVLTFFSFLSEQEYQEQWHRGTGYYPLSRSTFDDLSNSGYYDENPNFLTAIDQLIESPSNLATAGGIAGPFPEIRDLLETAIETILTEESSVQVALDDAARETQALLARYNQLVSD